MILRVEIRRVAALLDDAPSDLSWLSASEQARLDRLHLPARRSQYVAGHWLGRWVLARHLGRAAHDLNLKERRGLPPAVIVGGGEPREPPHPQPTAAPFLSITHSGAWVAVAVADFPVGIDLEEYPRRHNLAAVEGLLLAYGEAPGSVDDNGLLQRWVAKEARIKCDASEALPERLRAIELHAASWARSDVRLYRSAEFFFGIATSPDAVVELQFDGIIEPLAAWRTLAQ